MAWRLPTHIVVADGALARIGEETRRLVAGENVLLVLDPGLRATAWPQVVIDSLEASGYRVAVDDGIEVNPRTTTAERLGERARELSADLVVGLGGGSALDAAKAAAMLATNPRPVLELVGREVYRESPLPFVACPTTCGTGSEVTWVSVLSDPISQRKVSVKGVGMFPVLALVDPGVLATLPRTLVAWTAMDALTHAIEATTCRVANAVSDALAEQAIRLLLRSLPALWRDPEDHRARHEVALASTVAGMAFGNADVATVHCLSESIGGLLDLPHGLLNATLLVPTLRFEGDAVTRRLAELEANLGYRGPGTGDQEGERGGGIVDPFVSPTDGAEVFLRRLEALAHELEIPAPSSLGIESTLFPAIAAAAFGNGSNSSSPRPMGEQEYLQLLRSLS